MKRTFITSAFLFTILFLLILGCGNMDSNKQKFVITGHRGASGLAPENTLASMKKAMEIGANYSELDVHLTSDGAVVLLHDDTLDRTTNDSGAVYLKELSAIKKLDAGKWFGPEFEGEPIPTLIEVIDAVYGKMKLNIEIKISGNEPDIAEKVVAIVREKKFQKQCMITSFDKTTVLKVKEIAPELAVGYIIGGGFKEDPFNGPWEIISTNYKNVNEEFVEKSHFANKEVHVWTVNDESEMQRLIELKVDGIITNYPNILKNIL